jgi:hypothetical protein
MESIFKIYTLIFLLIANFNSIFKVTESNKYKSLKLKEIY